MYYLQPTKMEILLVTDDYYYYCIIPWILGKSFALLVPFNNCRWGTGGLPDSVRKLSPTDNGTEIKI